MHSLTKGCFFLALILKFNLEWCRQISKFNCNKNLYSYFLQIRSFASTTENTAKTKIENQKEIDKHLLYQNEKEFQRIPKDNRNKDSFLTAVGKFL